MTLTDDTKHADASFEATVERLSEIVQVLEQGDLPLERALELFEEGVRLSRASQKKLDAAQKRVEELLSVDRDGRIRTAPFDEPPKSRE